MRNVEILKRIKVPLAAALTVTGLWSQSSIYAQPTNESTADASQAARVDPSDINIKMEEVVTVGRLMDSSQQLVHERMDDAFATDLLGSDTIGRLGDSSVAAALRRVPGLTLLQDKFVYIRGLGERYSANSLNGAQIPSPDLTRNVIPLDIFPTSIVDSLRVQKSWSADLPANFAGGSVDIRTKGIPDSFAAGFEFSPGFNTENDSTALSYHGGSRDKWGADDGTRALSGELLSQVNQYQGKINQSNLVVDHNLTPQEARTVNHNLALMLNRDIGIQEEDVKPDYGFKANIGNNFLLSENWEAGFLVSGAYSTDWRTTTSISRNYQYPTERTSTKNKSTNSVNIASTANIGLKFTEDHSIETTTLFLRNTDDETEINDFFNEDHELSSGFGFRNYRLEFEQRELLTNQIKGSHYLGNATRELFPILDQSKLLNWLPTETHITWFYSDSEATTDIPNQVQVSSDTVTDPVTAAVLSESVFRTPSAADFRFTELEDDVLNYGWAFTMPFEFGESRLEIGGGYQHNQKSRTYYQAQFNLGPQNVASISALQGPLDQVFSDSNITDPNNNFELSRAGTDNQSYLAATMTDAVFGTLDWTFRETWRVAAGFREEQYRQVALGWNPFGFSAADPQITADADELNDAVFISDEYYPSASLTYMTDFWAETFQLRFGWSETAIRPDLREITDASYIDPITDEKVDGCSRCVPSDVSNYDIRAEWFFSTGDNLTATLFLKEIDNPIEFFESASSGTNTAREIVNAESAEVRGVEFEGLKELGFLGDAFETLFLQGNLTLQDSELVAGSQADDPTNQVRELAGASNYVVNLTFGFDSPDNKHSASLIYNVFGERLYVAGRAGAPDGFEQPFHSLDLTYSWYPTEYLTLKLKAQNLLGEKIEIEREGVTTFERDPGTSFALAFSWSM